jgi:hypothetical protein
MFQTKVVEKSKTRALGSIIFFPPESRAVEKYCRNEQATGDNMAHALCMLDN